MQKKEKRKDKITHKYKHPYKKKKKEKRSFQGEKKIIKASFIYLKTDNLP